MGEDEKEELERREKAKLWWWWYRSNEASQPAQAAQAQGSERQCQPGRQWH